MIIFSYGIHVAHTLKPTHSHINNNKRLVSLPKLNLFDHLIDCAQFPEIAAIYGGPQSSMCLGGQSGITRLFTGGLSQMITFALLLMSYYTFKRGANILDIGDDEEIGNMNRNNSRCPKCNGSGNIHEEYASCNHMYT
jgi:hypothetical protein